MRLKLQAFIVFVFCFTINYSVISQTNNARQHPLPVIDYDVNLNKPLTTVELSQIKEVYGDKTDEYVLNRPQRLKDIKNILRNRIQYKLAEPGTIIKECPLLSEVPLFNNYVSNLNRDVDFNPTTFNPLKYKFSFYTRGASIYKVDNTDYYIMINSQYQ